MAVFKTLQFLPEVFRTETNKKFLNATTDQLLSEPNLVRVSGYIGRKLAPSFKVTDSYVTEPTQDRQNYQVEPTIIIKNPVNEKLEFATTYADITNKISYYGGFDNNHNRLFDNEFYSYDPQIDLDKFVNFVQYYWLENGPDEIIISAADVPTEANFDITYDATKGSYSVSGFNAITNPLITLARGGSYTFNINEPGNKFFIQSKPGVSGFDPNLNNLETRNVLGVSNNGQDTGSVTFDVPSATAQIEWTLMPIVDQVNYATSLSYQDLQGCLISDLVNLGGFDGASTSFDNLSIVFVNNEYIDEQYWHNTARVIDDVIYLDQDVVVPLESRTSIFQTSVYPDAQGDLRLYLTIKFSVQNESKVRIISGLENTGREFYKRSNIFNQVPPLTAALDFLYYQSDQSDNAVGVIRLVDYNAFTIDPATEIVGQKNYVSPNGITFTNGLKITFDSTAVAPYTNNTYYVEGVGTSIKLVEANTLFSTELDNDLSNPDYITINRSSIDNNAWSRSNRWFHVNILEKTAEYNNTQLLINQNLRAQRPIIEFNPDLQLFNYGTQAKAAIDVLDDVITNAYQQVQGVIINYSPPTAPTQATFSVTINSEFLRPGRTYRITSLGNTNWAAAGAPSGFGLNTEFIATQGVTGTGQAQDTQTVTFANGDRIVFTADEDLNVRNKIYNFSIELFSTDPVNIYKAYFEEDEDSTIEDGHTVPVNYGSNGAKQWHFNGVNWVESQQKTSINQPPKFDIINNDGVSLGDNSFYPQSNFQGTKLFSYKIGSGTNDNVLGFPISYRNLATQGDIIFENNFDTDSFSYRSSAGLELTGTINSGLLQKNITRTTSSRINIWQINLNFSKQYQIFNFVYDGTTNLFPIDILPDVTLDSPNIKVTINNVRVENGNFAITQINERLSLLVNPDLLQINDAVFVSIFNSQETSRNAFYEVPLNLDINSLNISTTELTLGQMRNHLIAFKNNSLDIEGSVPGKSNLRDIFYTNRGGAILQHSAPVVYSGLFLNHPTMNFVDSLRLASKEYSKFKQKFLEFAANLEFDRQNIAGAVDTILLRINSVKNSNFPWQFSDMVPYGDSNKVTLPSYTVFDPEIRTYEITNIFQDTVVSNKAVLVYLTRTLDNITTTELLIKNRDYTFDQTRPAINIVESFTLLIDDIITVVEYGDTDGSYIPETPTKLGLYPKYIPEIYTDNTYRTPVPVIQGHDGSLTVAFGDFRDNLLLELEKRIYNNVKVEYDVNLFNINDYIPGKFRVLDYNLQEINQLLSQDFLRWAGTNRVNYTTNNTFTASDPFTWNLKKFRDIINGENFPGTWRSIYRYFYDTDRPHTHPWEMLGFSEKPSYWNDRYGPAPYTGGNFVLWSDLEAGYIHSGPRAGLDLRYSRPSLTSIIPVDDNGNLRSPTEFLATDYDSASANLSFAVGDIGPSELAWRRSSEFPFALHFALAIAKPAKYFGLLLDIQNYNRNLATSQFLVENNSHITPGLVKINGYPNADNTIERSAGYINWIVDYAKNLGINDASTFVKDNLELVSIQLSYKMAGFSDKKIINLLAEQFSPSSINNSVVIPDENYSIELYKGAPLDKLSYSAVIVEKTENGYTVSGYDVGNPYFIIVPSLANNNSYNIQVGEATAVIYQDFKNQRLAIPYGFEFTKKQQLVDFLISYQRYLTLQGFVFDERDSFLKEKKDWALSAKEFLHWTNQGWKTGNVLVLSPVSDYIKIFNPTAIIDEVTGSVYGSRILDINSKAIRKNSFTVTRDNGLFTIKCIENETIGFATFDFVQFEHLLLLDNTTVFNDVIYVPETGSRQSRLKLVGNKTGLWNGSLELPGYIFSSETVPEWLPGSDYLKGSLVSYKSSFYAALQNIIAADTFQITFWQKIDSNELRSGLINNFATNASQSLKYYDINDQPINEEIQLFSNGLIGFRPREYFTNLGIDVTTQSKFYQGLIKQSGTLNAIDALQGAQFNNLGTQPVSVFENWAIRVGEYGALETNNFLEFILPEQFFRNNPSVFQLANVESNTDVDIKTFTQESVYRQSGAFQVDFLKTVDYDQPVEFKPLPVAGFVHLDDIDNTVFDIKNYESYREIANEIGIGYTIWTARDLNDDWNVYRATPVPGLIFILRYHVNSQAEFVSNAPHGLQENDIVALKNFDPRYNGMYLVQSIIDDTRFLATIYVNLQELIESQAILGQGLLYKLTSSKFSTPLDIVNYAPYSGLVKNDKVWVETVDDQDNWGVYTKTDPWEYRDTIQLDQYAGFDHFGSAIALDFSSTYLYASAPDSGSGRIGVYSRDSEDDFALRASLFSNHIYSQINQFGKVIRTGTKNNVNSYLIASDPTAANDIGVVYVYKDRQLMCILTAESGATGDMFGHSLALSDDAQYLYVGAPGADKVYCYAIDYERQSAVQELIQPDNGSITTLSLLALIDNETDIIVSAPIIAGQFLPYIDYSLDNTKRASIVTFTFSGTAAAGTASYTNVPADGGSGTGATFNVSRSGGVYTVTLNNPGKGYVLNDTISILGEVLGGSSITNGLTINITKVLVGITGYTHTGSRPTATLEIFFYNRTATGGSGTGAKFRVSYSSASTNYTLILENAGVDYLVGDVLTIDGATVGGLSGVHDVTITVTAVGAVTNLVFTTPPASFLIIAVTKPVEKYIFLETLPKASEVAENSQFGSAVVCNSDGSVIAVGASNTPVNNVSGAGAVFVYHRTKTELITTGSSNTFNLPDAFGNFYRVYLDGVLQYDFTNKPVGVDADYTITSINPSQITFGDPGSSLLAARRKVFVETNQFVFDQVLYSSLSGLQGDNFGSGLAMCNSGCNIYVVSSDYTETDYNQGLVTRFLNVGRIYGSILSTKTNPTVTPGQSIIINDRLVQFSGSQLTNVITDINQALIPGVTASNESGKLKITSDVTVIGNKLNILNGNQGTPLADLGLEDYKFVQVFKHPENEQQFYGTSIAVDQTSGVLVIGSEGGDYDLPISFDQELPIITTFDGNTTNFVDILKDSGSVYVYDLLENPNENVDNPSLFAYSQKLFGPALDDNVNFGSSVVLNGKYLIAGLSNARTVSNENGELFYFYNENQQSGWTLSRLRQPRVDTNAVLSSFLYNVNSQQILDFFDYIDPAKGKLLGVVDQELDYKEEYDPASYNQSNRSDTINNTNFYWSDKQVGRTWWDLKQISFIDYEQDEITYRIKNWGSLFPGSQVRIFEWVESEFLPSQYVNAVGDGVPRYADNSAYSSVTFIDPVTGIVTQKYYYWIVGKTNVDVLKTKRTISALALQNYITSPKDQNIPYLALLAPNAVGLYNISDKLSGENVAVHFDLAQIRNTNLIHTEWQLVQQGASLTNLPTKIINKLKDSLAGFDELGAIVPDPALSAQDKLGVSLLPRQSMVVNRNTAITTYVETLNLILVKYPILLLSTPTSLKAEEPLPVSGFDEQTDSVDNLNYIDTSTLPNGYKILVPSDTNHNGKWTIYTFNDTTGEFNLSTIQSYKSTLYWTAFDWYDAVYQSGTTIAYTLNTFAEIQTISPAVGDYIKILDGGNGTWLLYEIQDDSSLSLIGAQNGTLQLNRGLYDPSLGGGYDTTTYDVSGYDPIPTTEFRFIFDGMVQQILTDELSVEFNNLFFAMLNYVFTEQKSPDWVIKTSLIDVVHNLRALEQFPNFTRDNQDFYNDYINEVKPYRTQIKEYIPNYFKQDNLDSDITDFDLPSVYDARFDQFRSPSISNQFDNELFDQPIYSDWANNYKFQIVDFIIGDIGLNYTFPPNVEITGGGGTGASALTTLYSNGSISGITITNPGSGYTFAPNVVINGDGSGATAYPILKNQFYPLQSDLSYNLVKNIVTSLKFDRTTYNSNLVIWTPNTSYSNIAISGDNLDPGNLYIVSGNLVVHENEVYLPQNANARPWLVNTIYPINSYISFNNDIYSTSGNVYASNFNATSVQSNVALVTQFDFTRFSRIQDGNVLLNALDRITAFYEPTVGMPGKNINELVSGTKYPASKVIGPTFRSNAFEVTSDIISFNYDGLTINSGNTAQFDFLDLGFDINKTIRIEAAVPFDFQNNGYFRIVGVDRDTMILTGQPVETTYKVTLNQNINADVGDYLTQANSSGNAWVLKSVTNSNQIDIIYSTPGFLPVLAGNVYANLQISKNGIPLNANVTSISNFDKTFTPIASGGNVEVTIAYLDQDYIVDSNIYSTYLDTNLGTRPEDINIVGGAYFDIYSSHAPEELIPGRLYDALEMRVFSNTVADTATYGYRVFQPMSANIDYHRISGNATTTLSNNLLYTDQEILVSDVTKLPEPNVPAGIPGVIYINGEKIHYYQKYDSVKLGTAIPWTANTIIAKNSLIVINSNTFLTLGNVFANSVPYINTSNIQLIKNNSLRQLRRGVDGTGISANVVSGNLVSDSSLIQLIPDAQITGTQTITGNLHVTSNASYRAVLTAPITASIGDYITQFTGNAGNARIIGGNVKGYRLFLSGTTSQLEGNVITQFGTSNATATIVETVNNSTTLIVTPNSRFISSLVDPVYINNKLTSLYITKVEKDIIEDDVVVVDIVSPGLWATANLDYTLTLSNVITAAKNDIITQFYDPNTYLVEFSSPITSNVGDYITQFQGNTFRLQLDKTISANIGDYITQFVGNLSNLQVIDANVVSNFVNVQFVTGNVENLKFATNIGTRVNIANLYSFGGSVFSTTSANIVSIYQKGFSPNVTNVGNANLRVTRSSFNSNVIPVQFVTGDVNVIRTAANVGTRANIANLRANTFNFTTANIVSITIAPNVQTVLRVRSSVNSSLTLPVEFISGNIATLKFATNVATRLIDSTNFVTNANVVSISLDGFGSNTFGSTSTRISIASKTTGVIATTANILTLQPIGQITFTNNVQYPRSLLSNGNVVLNGVTTLKSNIWEQFGVTLQNSTTTAAQFIREQTSYIP